MSDNDLIRRGDVLAAAKGFIGAETAITALPAADPLADPRVQALVEAAKRAAHATTNDGITGRIYTDAAIALQRALSAIQEATK
jgi:hypothetical protein